MLGDRDWWGARGPEQAARFGRRLIFVDRARLPEDGGILQFEADCGERMKLAPIPFVHANRMIDETECDSTTDRNPIVNGRFTSITTQ